MLTSGRSWRRVSSAGEDVGLVGLELGNRDLRDEETSVSTSTVMRAQTSSPQAQGIPVPRRSLLLGDNVARSVEGFPKTMHILRRAAGDETCTKG